MAANANLAAFMDKILTAGLTHLRGQLTMPLLVNRDFSAEGARKGDYVNVQLPLKRTVKTVTAAVTAPTPEAVIGESVAIPLDQWKHADFPLTDREEKEMNANAHFIPAGLEAAVDSIAEEVNRYLLQMVTVNDSTMASGENKAGFANQIPFMTSGTAATAGSYAGYAASGYAGAATIAANPFAAAANFNTTMQDLLLCAAENKWPRGNRRIVLSPSAYSSLAILDEFKLVQNAPDALTRVTGVVGQTYGFILAEDLQVQNFTPGDAQAADAGTTDAIAAYVNNGAGYAAETPTAQSRTIAFDDGGETANAGENFKVGDVISINLADDAARFREQYVVTAVTGNAQAGTLTIFPGLKRAIVDDDEIFIYGGRQNSHKQSPCFHREAITMVNRSLAPSVADLNAGRMFRTMTDPATGLTLRLELLPQYKQSVWDIDILYGGRVTRPELGCRIPTL